MKKIEKKLAVITGGTGGIGFHLSMGFQQAGYRVVAIDYTEHKKLSGDIHYIGADLSQELEVKRAFEEIVNRYGPIHVLVNNAAISQFNKAIQDITIHEFDQVINVNLRGTFLSSKLFIEANKGQDYGRIINIASTRWNQNTDYDQLSDLDHSQHPSGRVGKPDDIVRACLFLADIRNDFINGHNLVVDGGMTKKMIYE